MVHIFSYANALTRCRRLAILSSVSPALAHFGAGLFFDTADRDMDMADAKQEIAELKASAKENHPPNAAGDTA